MIYLAAQVVPGIILRGKPLWPALLAGLVLALINAVVRPVLKLITLPLTLLTLGLFLFVLNAFCLWLTSAVVPGFDIHGDRKSTRLNSSHQIISYAVFCLKNKK